MSFFHFDVHSDIFTPQEYQVEIFNVGKLNDLICCCLLSQEKDFLSSMLIQEYFYRSDGIIVYLYDESDINEYENNPNLNSKYEKNVFPFESLSSIPSMFINDGTDLKRGNLSIPSVISCSRNTFLEITDEKSTQYSKHLVENLNLIIISNVHEGLVSSIARDQLTQIIQRTKNWNTIKKPFSPNTKSIRTVFLSISLLHYYGKEGAGFWKMEEAFRKLENICEAKIETTSDIVALLRYSMLPTERIILAGPPLHSHMSTKLMLEIKNLVEHFRKFLIAHNFNPAGSLGYSFNEYQELVKTKPAIDDEITLEGEEDEHDSLAEELRKIPHPNVKPLELLKVFEDILDSLGPWCANRAIHLLNNQVTQLKIQVPYVRHYLLLGALQTRLIWIQTILNDTFQELDQLEVIQNYSTPKLLALLDILRRFDLTKPLESKYSTKITDDESDDEEDSEVELTVADYLEQQKQLELKSGFGSGRCHGRRKQYRQRLETKQCSKKFPRVEIVTSKSNDSFNSANTSINNRNNGPNEVLKIPRKNKPVRNEESLCGLLICEDRLRVRLLYHFLAEASDFDPKLVGLVPSLALPGNSQFDKDSREAEFEYKKREEALRKFRYRQSNLLVGTSLLEDGIELPKANLVIRWDECKSFRSYLFSKGRSQGYEPEYYIFTEESDHMKHIRQLSSYKLVEEMLLKHTFIPKPQLSYTFASFEQDWISTIPEFKCANLTNAISLINRYCARLPSDSFTRLTPAWKLESRLDDSKKYYTCNLRLPINSPVKWTISGILAPTEKLAMKIVALQTVIALYENGELDDNLMPVGKEGVSLETDLSIGEDFEEEEYGDLRPGSTRRRQYYDKQISTELLNCLPAIQHQLFLYWIKLVLTCPLPEDQNTRGRQLFPPEAATQAFGILLRKEIPPIPPFPVYTRCGEVLVELVPVNDSTLNHLTSENLSSISAFHHYTFTSVLRLDKYLTLFDPELSESSFFVVPLKALGKPKLHDPIKKVKLDWDFLTQIWKAKDQLRPSPVTSQERKSYKFDRNVYIDAVVTPWYRNNDQPQFFYVAEICTNLTPRSQFPGCEFKTFEEYYQRKYNLSIHDVNQPLLDVDHTSARLNFLTPRYVNRKGMALPTSSEATKKAKRENLEQKQILVPELCAVHPFSASLWRQAVCLPCILYRVNSLLLANSIRIKVASQIFGLGQVTLPKKYRWETLSFGWSLQDVFGTLLNKTESEKDTSKHSKNLSSNSKQPVPLSLGNFNEKKKRRNVKEGFHDSNEAKWKFRKDQENDTIHDETEFSTKASSPEKEISGFEKAAKEDKPSSVSFAESLLFQSRKHQGKSANEILSEEMKNCRQPELEIGVWSNDMASGSVLNNEQDFDEDEDELLDPNVALPSNLMMLDKNWTWGGRSKLFNHRVHRALYGSPTHWGEVWDRSAFEPPEDLDNSKERMRYEDDAISINSDSTESEGSYLDGDNNLKIQFEGNTAEALDKRKFGKGFDDQPREDWSISEELWWPVDDGTSLENSNQSEPDSYSWSPEKEEKLKYDFDCRVEERSTDISNVYCWKDILNLPQRKRKNFVPVVESKEEKNTKTLDYLKENTQLEPPLISKENYASTSCLSEINQEYDDSKSVNDFSFDFNPPLKECYGPNPCIILQALTMSNANDGHNLERLETIGDSFLKYAITSYLFCTYELIHEGKLSHLRSKQVSNVHLYRLGKRRKLGEVMISSKFEPHDNWLPPCYHIPKDLDKALIQSQNDLGTANFSMAQVNALKGLSGSEIEEALKDNRLRYDTEFVPYNLVTQQSIPDKSIADCVEALIGAYLTSNGPNGALLFMSWLGMRVLPSKIIPKSELDDQSKKSEQFYMTIPNSDNIILFNILKPPKSPLLHYNCTNHNQLNTLLKGYDKFENYIGYFFRDRSYLLQAFTHASYSTNNLTDCYQRLEFLGDAILDYLITRHLYEDKRQHSPGSLTDLRSALVNNTIFASLAVKNGFHRYFRHASPGLMGVLQKFVTFQEQHSHTLTQDYYLTGEEECEEAEDVEVPKALGDVFESVAGAIFLDSGMSLDAVWKVYYKMMKEEIDLFSENVPKSPIRELLELEPETAKFGKPEKLWDGRRVRVSVEVRGVGVFRGIGRNYRIAKCTAAKCALRHLRRLRGNNPRSNL